MLEPRHASAIADQFELGRPESLEGPVARGEQGQIWRLVTSSGRWAVREPFEPQTEDEVREDAGISGCGPRRRRAHAHGSEDVGGRRDRREWPTPRYGCTSGSICATPTPASIRRWWARCWRGCTLSGFVGTREEDPWYTDAIGAHRWDELVDALAAEEAPFAGEFASIRDELVALEGLLEPAQELRTCHRDLWADNLRSTATGELCVIDWDNCGAADPSHELANALFEFAGADPARARTLHRAYVAAGGPGRVTDRGSFSMAIAQLGHITEISMCGLARPERLRSRSGPQR